MKYISKINITYFGIGLFILAIFLCIPFIKFDEHMIKLLDNYKRVLELVSFVSLTIGSLGVLFSYLSYQDTQRNNNFNIVNSCMLRYSNILPHLIKLDKLIVEEKVKEDKIDLPVFLYYDLTEEQLTYLNLGYIPDYIQDLWIKGIKNQIVIFLDIDKKFQLSITESNYTKNYSRLTSVIKIIRENREVTSAELKKGIHSLRE